RASRRCTGRRCPAPSRHGWQPRRLAEAAGARHRRTSGCRRPRGQVLRVGNDVSRGPDQPRRHSRTDCGAGGTCGRLAALTRPLHERLQAAATLGLDRSPRMLAVANQECATDGVRFDERDIATFPAEGEQFDLVFSNAALHWIDDHARVFERLASALASGGQIAVQMPAMHADVSQVTATELAREEPFRSALNGWRFPQAVLMPEQYAHLLFRLGFHEPSVRLIVYPHVLGGPEEVVEWVKGTVLAEYSRHLPDGLFDAFVD